MKKGLPNLRGKVAVVTGAASGIGRALAVELARKGSTIALVDLDEGSLTGLQGELADMNGCSTSVHCADVSDRDRMSALADEVVQAHGAVHLLINNAGIAYEAAFSQTSLDDFERVLGVNLWGVIHGCRFFMPHLAKVDRAHIVNLSSLFGIVGLPGQTAYSASKFAVRGLSESLWEELRATSIGLTVVHPGGVATNIMKSARGDDRGLLNRVDAWYGRHALAPERVAARIIRAVERGKSRLLITREAFLADMVKRLVPVAGNKLVSDGVIRVLGLEDMRQKRLQQWQETVVDSDPPR